VTAPFSTRSMSMPTSLRFVPDPQIDMPGGIEDTQA
jgi:hypothetical protein